MGHFKKGLGHFADMKVPLECAEKEKNLWHLWLFTPGVPEHVKLGGGKPQHLSGNKTGCSQLLESLSHGEKLKLLHQWV